jgi:hypothetical protein
MQALYSTLFKILKKTTLHVPLYDTVQRYLSYFRILHINMKPGLNMSWLRGIEICIPRMLAGFSSLGNRGLFSDPFKIFY